MTPESLEQLERALRGLLSGKHSSLTLSWNDMNGPNYMSVGEYLDHQGPGSDGEWVSDAERQRAIETESWWNLHWYPDTPVGSYSMSAASLPALIEHVCGGHQVQAPADLFGEGVLAVGQPVVVSVGVAIGAANGDRLAVQYEQDGKKIETIGSPSGVKIPSGATFLGARLLPPREEEEGPTISLRFGKVEG